MEIGKSAALLDANSINIWPITNANNLYYIETKGETTTTASGVYLYPITGNYIGLWNGRGYSWTSIDIMNSADDSSYIDKVANNNSVITGIGIRKVPRNTGLSTSSSNEGKIVPEQRFAGIVYQTDTKSNIVNSGLNADINQNVVRELIGNYLNTPAYFYITGDIEIEQRTFSSPKETLELKAKTLSSVSENPAKTKMSLYQGKTLRFGGESNSSYTSEFNAMEGPDANASTQTGEWTSRGNWLMSKNAGGVYKRPSWTYTDSVTAGSGKTNIFAWISDIDYVVEHYDASINAINNTLSSMNGTIGGLMERVSFGPTDSSENIYQITSQDGSKITYYLNSTLNLRRVITDTLESSGNISSRGDIISSGNITALNGTIKGKNVTVSNLLTSNSIKGTNVTVDVSLTSYDIISTNSIKGKNITTSGAVTVGNTLSVSEGGEQIKNGNLILDKGNIKCNKSGSSIDVSIVNCSEINLGGSSNQFLLGNGLSGMVNNTSAIPVKVKLSNSNKTPSLIETIQAKWNNTENAYCIDLNLNYDNIGIPFVETPSSSNYKSPIKNIKWVKYGNIINVSGQFDGNGIGANATTILGQAVFNSLKEKSIGYNNEIYTFIWTHTSDDSDYRRELYLKIKLISNTGKLEITEFSPNGVKWNTSNDSGFNITFIAY